MKKHLKIGDRVNLPQWGEGVVIAVDKNHVLVKTKHGVKKISKQKMLPIKIEEA